MTVFEGPGLVFDRANECSVETARLDSSELQPGQVIVEVEVSVVSAGTEVANFTGLDPGTRVPGSWNYFPHRPGYGAVGHIVALGPPAPGLDPNLEIGDRVFAICRHARYGVVETSNRPIVPLLAEDDAETMVLSRMASVAITSVRKASSLDLGGRAVVIGLGLVGNFAAQLLQLSGLSVLGLDRSAPRVELAKGVALTAVLVGEGEEREVVEAVLGSLPDLVIEASGIPDSSPTAVALARDGGEVILLGSPRGVFSGDATQMLSNIHIRGIHLIGALEWLMPLHVGPWQGRWSLYDDYLALFDLVRSGRLRTSGLVTDAVPPADAPDMYTRLAAHEPGIGGVLFDWR